MYEGLVDTHRIKNALAMVSLKETEKATNTNQVVNI
ncbi:hypothetical protein BVRB_9g214020 [Beta vulgaris subsp. vulgaris]|nr:hypothetical protein BVRB_9g214020 [Beta vulgaris subsp. vulgaris]